MSAVQKMLCLGLLQAFFLSTVTAQIFQNIPGPQMKNVQPIPYIQQQQPLTPSLLSAFTTPMPIGEKIGAIANVIQKLPANPRAHQRQCMAEALRQSALENLMMAANACKCNPKAEGVLPLPMQKMTVGGDVIGQRAVKVKYI